MTASILFAMIFVATWVLALAAVGRLGPALLAYQDRDAWRLTMADLARREGGLTR